METVMDQDMTQVLFTQDQLAARVAQLAAEITQDYPGGNPVIVGILRGSFVFLADLVRQISLPVQVEFMAVASYGAGTASSGQVQLRMDLETEIRGRDVILVEDILDSGNTLSKLIPQLWERGPRSLKVCVLLDKPDRHVQEIPVAYLGFSIPDAFVVGYGLDYNQKYRNLPYVGILKPQVYGGSEG